MSGNINDYKNKALSGIFEQDTAYIKEIFKNDAILRSRHIEIGGRVRASLFYFDGMVNSEILNGSVVRSMITARLPEGFVPNIRYVSENILFAGEVTLQSSVADMLSAILYGDTLLIIEGSAQALTLDTKGWRTRGVSEPEDEHILSGPREGFDEAAIPNLALLRRKLLTPDLNIESMRVGRRSGTSVYICYLGALANKNTVNRLKAEISKINIDGILDSNYIAEEISRRKFPLFKTIGTTERPDVVAARILEGRIAVMVDGTPVVLTLPYLFSENFQSDEDYYQNFTVASISRTLRYICFFLSIMVPGGFIALTCVHPELLPTPFALAVATLRSEVPMSSIAESLLLIFAFEILKETGIRAPQSQGTALSIVGGLVVGQAAVEAKIISAPVLIAVSLSSIAALAVPRLKSAVFYLKVAVLIASGLFGLLGFFSVMSIFLLFVLNADSFGTDYTVSLKRAGFQQLKDTVFRAPWQEMKLRPQFNKNLRRQGDKK